MFQVRTWIRTHSEAFAKAYPPRQVNNIYFDTLNLDSLNDHLNGLNNRHKLRCRWYGELTSPNNFTVELKEKSGMLGWKKIQKIEKPLRIQVMSWSETMRYLHKYTMGNFRELIAKSTPCLINNYKREYYVSADGDTRLTLDSKITSYNQIFSQFPNTRFPIMNSLNAVVIELKVPEDNGQLSRILSGFPLRIERYSKYVDAMTID